MVNPLIGLHVVLGEIGVAAFIWVFVETLNPDKRKVARSKLVALLGVIFIFASWIVGGYYYVDTYGKEVKPIIKSGPQPWAHGVFMETKEHVFIFLPFLSILTAGLLFKHGNKLARDSNLKKSVLLLCALIVLIGLIMLGTGYAVSSGARAALEGGI